MDNSGWDKCCWSRGQLAVSEVKTVLYIHVLCIHLCLISHPGVGAMAFVDDIVKTVTEKCVCDH